MYLLDSSAILEIINDTQKSKEIILDLKGDLFTTPFSLYEVFYGVRQSELTFIEKLLTTLTVVNFDTNSSFVAVTLMRDLEKRGRKINLVDVFIASIAISHDLTLVSLDKDFKKIKGLKFKVYLSSVQSLFLKKEKLLVRLLLLLNSFP